MKNGRISTLNRPRMLRWPRCKFIDNINVCNDTNNNNNNNDNHNKTMILIIYIYIYIYTQYIAQLARPGLRPRSVPTSFGRYEQQMTVPWVSPRSQARPSLRGASSNGNSSSNSDSDSDSDSNSNSNSDSDSDSDDNNSNSKYNTSNRITS